MKVALFDCFSGASGDMMLGALLDAGMPLAELRKGLGKIKLNGYSLSARKESRRGIAGTRLVVKIRPQKTPRHLSDILKLIRGSSLSPAVKDDAAAVFERIGRVESKIHRIPLEKVHFHEIGAVDSILDIVGVCHAVHFLGLKRIYFTPPALGSGWARTAHGKFPVPAPATVALLKGVPARWGKPSPGEWTTPTGAALLAHFGECAEDMPAVAADNVGYGVGKADPEGHPNVLRVVSGSLADGVKSQTVWSVQTNLDDMDPRIYGPVTEKLFRAGALDVFLTPIQMKKGRPGTILEVLTDETRRADICRILLEETTTFGLRMQRMEREILDREIRRVPTPWGPIRFKMGKKDGRILKAIPEFADCLAAAARKGIAVAELLPKLAKYAPGK